jgi:hypothetical protein
VGVSTLVNSITVNGIDNEMPNQTLVGTGSVLTRGLGDALYAHVGMGGFVGIQTATPIAPLDVGGKIATLNSGITTPIATFSNNSNSISGIDMRDTSAGANSEFRFTVSDNNGDAYLAFTQASTPR